MIKPLALKKNIKDKKTFFKAETFVKKNVGLIIFVKKSFFYF